MSRPSQKKVRGPLKIRDVANLAGVSIATVSRVLHNSPLVDPVTAERVRAVVREVNYVPNATGPALKSGRSGLFGIIVPDIANPFFADFVKHFERLVVDRDQEMLLAITDHSPEQMSRCVRRMLMRGVEGIAILESEIETRSYETMLHNQVPLVTLNRLQLEPGVSDVAVDADSGMIKAVAHLRGLGHRSIGFLGGTHGQRIAIAREASFRVAMRANDLIAKDSLITDASFHFEGGRRALAHLLSLAAPPTAVLCANDMSAFGALMALADRGLVAGRELSVVGLDDLDMCTMVHPQLTTLRLPREKLAGLYLGALGELVKGPHTLGTQFVQELEFIPRETTGPCPVSRRERKSRARA